MAYRYEGLRKKDFYLVLRHLRDCLEDEGGPFSTRPSFQKFEHWVLIGGKAIRGSKKRPKQKLNKWSTNLKENELVSATVSKVVEDEPLYRATLFGKIFDLDDELIWPLQLIDPRDEEQFRVIYPLLFKLPHTVMYYLNDLIFPEVLAYQGLKLSACGQELGGDLIFSRKIGFSGTPSDILPLELGSCQYERGSDGKVIHYLTSPEIVNTIAVPPKWDAKSILELVAKVRYI